MNRYVSTIQDAIKEKRVLVIKYHSWTQERAVEPHAVGVTEDGSELMRAWQEFGASESGERSGWKLFTLSKISSMRMSETSFAGARAGYKRGDTAMQRIYAQL